MLAVVVAVVLVGVIPALHATRATSATGAAAFGRGSSESAATHRFRRGLVVMEVALSSGLLVGAALFLTSLSYVQHLPVGFDLSGLAAAAVILPADTYPTPERQGAFFNDVLGRLTPKVAGAAIAFGLPFAGDNFVSPYVIRGRAIPPPAARRRAGLRIVSEDYLTVMRIRLVAGRFFSAADRAGAQPVCVVNESFSRREFGNRSPLGAVVLRGRDADQPFEIVGVLADVRTNGPTADPPDELFLPFRQVARPNAWLLVRTNGRPETAAPLLQSAVAAADRVLAISGFTTMEAARALTMGPERLLAGLATVFGLLALLLAAIGLYAVLAQSVTARTGEIGIRIAIGAGRWSIGRLVLTGALRLVGMGMLVGLTGAMAMSRIIAAQLHGISGRDPTVYAVVAGMFVVVAIAAAACPRDARRVSTRSPVCGRRNIRERRSQLSCGDASDAAGRGARARGSRRGRRCDAGLRPVAAPLECRDGVDDVPADRAGGCGHLAAVGAGRHLDRGDVRVQLLLLPPVGGLTIADPQNWVAMVAFLVVSLIGSRLSGLARARAEEALSARDELARLFDLSRDVLLITETADALAAVARAIARRFELDFVGVALPASGEWRVSQSGASRIELDPAQLSTAFAAAQAALEFDAHARTYVGHRTMVVAGRTVRLVPLRVGTKPVGLLAAAGRDIPPGTLDALGGVAAIAIERVQLLDAVEPAS